MRKCDCTVMNLHTETGLVDFITLSEVVDAVNDAADIMNQPTNIRNKHVFRPEEWVYEGNGLSTMFYFCPFCGKEINWDQITAEILE